jgi:hypothetical protein
MVGLLLDYNDQDDLRDALIIKIGSRRFAHIRQAKADNGRSPVDNRDLCAELNNVDLEKVCRKFRIKPS